MKIKLLVLLASLTTMSHAGLLVSEDSSGDTLNGTVWDVAVGSSTGGTVIQEDGVVKFSHVTGAPQGSQRTTLFGNTATGLLNSNLGYAKFTIGDLGGATIQSLFAIAGQGTFSAAKKYVASFSINSTGTYEIFFNNTANASANFDNGNGWVGTLAAEQMIWRKDAGTANTQIAGPSNTGGNNGVNGDDLAQYENANSFGFSAFAGSPTGGFTVDNFELHDTLTIPEPATIGLVGMVGVGLLFIRRTFVL